MGSTMPPRVAEIAAPVENHDGSIDVSFGALVTVGGETMVRLQDGETMRFTGFVPQVDVDIRTCNTMADDSAEVTRVTAATVCLNRRVVWNCLYCGLDVHAVMVLVASMVEAMRSHPAIDWGSSSDPEEQLTGWMVFHDGAEATVTGSRIDEGILKVTVHGRELPAWDTDIAWVTGPDGAGR